MKVVIYDAKYVELRRKATINSGYERLPKDRDFTRMIYDAGLLLAIKDDHYVVEKDVTHNHIGRKIAIRTLKKFLSLYEYIESVERFELEPEELAEYNYHASKNLN